MALGSASGIAQLCALAAGIGAAIILHRHARPSGNEAIEIGNTLQLAASHIGALGFAIEARSRARRELEIQIILFETILEHQPLGYGELLHHASDCMDCTHKDVRSALARIWADGRVEFAFDPEQRPADIRACSFSDEYLKVLKKRALALGRGETALRKVQDSCERFLKNPGLHRISPARRLECSIRETISL
jgi:hypothetical protein